MCMPRSSTPASSSRPASCGVSIRPSVFLTTSALAGIISRGSITRPAHSLCTLRSADHSATTQHSVPAGGQPLPGGAGSPLGPVERFPRSRLHLFPLSQALPGALGNSNGLVDRIFDIRGCPAPSRAPSYSCPCDATAETVIVKGFLEAPFAVMTITAGPGGMARGGTWLISVSVQSATFVGPLGHDGSPLSLGMRARGLHGFTLRHGRRPCNCRMGDAADPETAIAPAGP